MKTIRHIEQQKIDTVINSTDFCNVAFFDPEQQTPYIIPMSFGYKDQELFLHSAPEGRSIDIVKKNPKVCVSFVSEQELIWQHPDIACSYTLHGASVIAFGEVEFVEDFDQKIDVLKMFMKHYSDRDFKFSTPAVNGVKVWRIKLHDMSCKEFGLSERKQNHLFK